MKLSGPFLFILGTVTIEATGVGIASPIILDLMGRMGASSSAQGALRGGVMMSAYAGVFPKPSGDAAQYASMISRTRKRLCFVATASKALGDFSRTS